MKSKSKSASKSAVKSKVKIKVKSAAKKGAAPKAKASKAKTKPQTKALAKTKATKKIATQTSSAKSVTAKSKKPVAPTKASKASTVKTLASGALQISTLRDRVVIEPIGESDRTPGGLYIPQTAEEKPQRGRVMAVGSGLVSKKGKVRPLDVKLGDEVLYGKYAGTEIELQGFKLLILKESDIVGILA